MVTSAEETLLSHRPNVQNMRLKSYKLNIHLLYNIYTFDSQNRLKKLADMMRFGSCLTSITVS